MEHTDSTTKYRSRRWRPQAQIETPLGPVDLWLSAVTLALLTIGVVMVYGASIGPASMQIGDPGYYVRRQLLNVGMGALALIGGLLVPYKTWRKLAYPGLLLSIVLLVALLFVGITYGRSTRWLKLGFMNFQPAELAKIAFIIYLARSIAEKTELMKRFSIGFLPHALVLGVIMLLSLAQPDLGTCIILAMLMVMMLFVAGTRAWFIAGSIFGTLAIGAFVIATSSSRWGRIIAYLDPWSHRYDKGFQTANALTTLGSGGATGTGLGAGPQTVGGFLPEAESDFILNVVGEQLGFVGVAVVLVLFGLLVVRGCVIAYRVDDDFGRFLAFGLTMLLGLQSSINAAVSVGLVPTKGLTLPFISYGGSSLLLSMLAIGILLNISRQTTTPVEEEEEVPDTAAGALGGLT